MPLVVADTGPLNYLVLIGDIGLLPRLFETLIVPETVRDELAHPEAPEPVRIWIAQAPPWLQVQPNPAPRQTAVATSRLDPGECAVISLAVAAKADLVLMDDRDGVAAARREGLAVTGTLGVLDLAARRGMVDLADAFARLKATTFYYRQGLLDALLARQRRQERE